MKRLALNSWCLLVAVVAACAAGAACALCWPLAQPSALAILLAP